MEVTGKAGLKTHITSIHENKKFNCNICHSSYSSVNNLRRHVATIHEKNKPIKCIICKASFAFKSELERHVVATHEGKKPESPPGE